MVTECPKRGTAERALADRCGIVRLAASLRSRGVPDVSETVGGARPRDPRLDREGLEVVSNPSAGQIRVEEEMISQQGRVRRIPFAESPSFSRGFSWLALAHRTVDVGIEPFVSNLYDGLRARRARDFDVEATTKSNRDIFNSPSRVGLPENHSLVDFCRGSRASDRVLKRLLLAWVMTPASLASVRIRTLTRGRAIASRSRVCEFARAVGEVVVSAHPRGPFLRGFPSICDGLRTVARCPKIG